MLVKSYLICFSSRHKNTHSTLCNHATLSSKVKIVLYVKKLSQGVGQDTSVSCKLQAH